MNSVATTRAVAEKPAVDAQNPWPGLFAYEESLQPFFFGRREVAEELFRQVKRRVLTVLFGRSGLGKTSLLRAGLFPKLRREGFLPVPLRLDFAEEAPDLVAQVKSALSGALAAASLDEAARPAADETLWEYFHRASVSLTTPDGKPLVPVLVFDQFEELFTLGRDDELRRRRSDRFLTELADLVENRAPAEVEQRIEEDPGLVRNFVFERQDYRVLISLREDFLPELESLQSRMSSLAGGRIRLTALNGQQALEAVVKPGRGLVSAEVGRQIVRFVAAGHGAPRGDGDGKADGDRENLAGLELTGLEVEPSLLSLVCRELNTRRINQHLEQITPALLEGNSQSILQDFYSRCLSDQPAGVRVFVEDELLTDSGFRDNVEAGRARRAIADRGAPASAIDELVKRRLLHVEERLGVQRVELTHDVLVPVVKQSRDERQQREAIQRAKEHEEQRREGVRVQRRRRLAILAAMVGAAALVVITSFGGVSFYLYQENKRALEEANQQKKLAEGAREEAVREKRSADQARQGLAAAFVRSRWLLYASQIVLSQFDWEVRGPGTLTLKGHTKGVTCLAFSPDGRQIGSGSLDETIKVWGAASGQVIHTLKGHTAPVMSVAFSPDGKWIASGSVDKTIRLWDAASGKVSRTLNGHTAAIESVAFSPDGTRIASGSDDDTVTVWNPASGREILTLKAHTAPVTSVAFSPDGTWIASGSEDTTIKVWDAASGQMTLTFRGHTEPVRSVTFSPDGKRIASGSTDKTIKLWDVTTRQATLTLKAHSDAVARVAFSSDGERAASGSSDGTIKVWDASLGYDTD